MKTRTFLTFMALWILLSAGFCPKSGAQKRPVKQRPGTIRGIDTLDRKGLITSYPTNFIASTMKLGYEFRISPNKGLKFIGSLGSSTSNSDWYSLSKFTEYGLEAQLRFYVLKDKPAMNGFYLAPYVSYKSMSYTSNTYVLPVYPPIYSSSGGKVSDFTVGYIIGYQWIFNSSFSIDAFIGGGFNTITGDNTQGTLGTDIYGYRSGIGLHTGVGLGVAF